MWNAVRNDVSRHYSKKHSLDVLEQAVSECIEFDVRSSELYEALDFLQKSCPNTWGLTLFREGLELRDWNMRAEYLTNGLKYIRKHLACKLEKNCLKVAVFVFIQPFSDLNFQ